MKCTKPLVHGNKLVGSVIDLKVLVMEIVDVMIIVYLPTAENELPEPRMSLRGRKREVLKMVNDVERMRRNDPVHEHSGKVQNMLNGMHGQPGPWTEVDVLVMEAMHCSIDRRPVKESVDQIKVCLVEKRYADHQTERIQRRLLPADDGYDPVGLCPERCYLVDSPDWDGTRESPERVVIDLIAEKEPSIVSRGPTGAVLITCTLILAAIKAQMPHASHQKNECAIAKEDYGNPARREHLCDCRAWRRKPPRESRKERVEDVPRQQITWKPED